jgi:hypothetical protein
MTVDEGPLTAATVTSGASRPTSPAPIQAIAPRPDRRSSARLRSATILAASSRDKIPARQAAAISPCEWPITAAGRTP